MKRKRCKRILAMMLAVAMTVTILPTTSIMATQTEENIRKEGDISVIEVSEPLDEVTQEIMEDEHLMTEIEVTDVPGATRENPLDIEEEKQYTARLVLEEDEADLVFVYRFRPQKSGVYEVVINGDADYLERESFYYKKEIVVIEGNEITTHFFDDNVSVPPQDFQFMVRCKEEWDLADELLITEKVSQLALEEKRLYPVRFDAYGTYSFIGTKDSGSNFDIYSRDSYNRWGLEKTTYSDITIKKDDTYYFYAAQGDVVKITYEKCGALELGENSLLENRKYYSFQAPEAGSYAFFGFYDKDIFSGTDLVRNPVFQLKKDEIVYVNYYFRGYFDESVGYVIFLSDEKQANLGSYSLNSGEIEVVCYENNSKEVVDLWLSSGNAIYCSEYKEGDTGFSYIESLGGTNRAYEYSSILPNEKKYIFFLNNSEEKGEFSIRKLSKNEEIFTYKTTSFNQSDSTLIKYVDLSEIHKLGKEMLIKVTGPTDKITDNTRIIRGVLREDNTIFWNSCDLDKDNSYLIREADDYLAVYEDNSSSIVPQYNLSVIELEPVFLDLSKENSVEKGGYYRIKLALGADSGWYKVTTTLTDGSDEYWKWYIQSIQNDDMDFEPDRNQVNIYLENDITYTFSWFCSKPGTIKFERIDNNKDNIISFDQTVNVTLTKDYCKRLYFIKPEKTAYVAFSGISDNLKDAKLEVYEINDFYFKKPTRILQPGKEYMILVSKYVMQDEIGTFRLYNNTFELEKIQAFQNAITQIGDIENITVDSKNGIEAAKEKYEALSDEAKNVVTEEYEFLKIAEKKYIELLENYKPVADEADKKKAEETVALIKSIGEVTLDKKETIEKARAAYEALPAGAKKYVSEEILNTLKDAETKYLQMKAAAEEAAKKAAEEAKEKVGAENVIDSVTYVVAENQTVVVKNVENAQGTSVKIPSTVTINNKTFAVTEIAANAFKNNKKLKTVSIGKNVKKIGDNAFMGCSSLTKIIIPAKVEKIGKKAFYNCKKLKTVTMKTTVLKSVGKAAFKNIAKGATIKVNKKKLAAYKKLLKGKTTTDSKIK